MRKKIFVLLGIFCFVTLIVGLIYWQTMITNYLTTMLSEEYDLTLAHNGLSFSLQGDVVIEDPQIIDQRYPEYEEFLSAESFGVGFNIQNAFASKMPLKRVRTDQFKLNLQRLPDGSLHLARVIQRFIPGAIESTTTSVVDSSAPKKNTGTINSDNIPSTPLPESTNQQKEQSSAENITPSTAQESPQNTNITGEENTSSRPEKREFVLPEIMLNNSSLNYENTEGVKYQVDFERFQTLPDILGLEFNNGIAWRRPMEEEPLGTADYLQISKVFKPGDKLLGFKGNNIEFRTNETEPGRYDMRTTYFAWKAVIDEIADQFKPKEERNKKSKSKVLVDTLNLKDVTLRILPLDVEGDKNVISIDVGLIKLVQGNDLTFQDIQVYESGKPTLKLAILSFTGLKHGTATVSKVEGQDITLNIREGDQDSLNVNQVVSHVQALVNDFVRKEDRVASASPTQPSFWNQFDTIAFNNIDINYDLGNHQTKKMSIGAFSFHPGNRNAKFSSWHIDDPNNEQLFVKIPNLEAIFSEDNPYKVIQTVISDNINIQAQRREDGLNLTKLVKPWLDLPKKLQIASNVHRSTEAFSTNPNEQPFQIKDFKVQNARVEVTDFAGARRVVHRFDPVQLEWNDMVFSDAGNQEGLITAHLNMEAPSQGKIVIRGNAAPSLEPYNAKLIISARSNDITGFRSYMSNKFYTFEKGGIKIDGEFKVDNNFLNTTFDIVLLDPHFQIKENNLSINAMTMQRALNGMKNYEGNIVLPNNQLTGNIKDPQFRLGTGIFEVITRNLLHGLTNIPGLAFDVAGFGANVVTETVKTIGIGVGSVLNNILGGDNNPNSMDNIP